MNKHILAFRSFDLRDRFPMPFASFSQALEALQSPMAYMPECGKVICYLKNGHEITIPQPFFIESKPRFENSQEAKSWLIKRSKLCEDSPEKSFISSLGSSDVDFTKPLAEQVEEALLFIDEKIIDADKNEEVTRTVTQYLDEKISDIIFEEEKRMRHYKKTTQYKVETLTCDKCHKKVAQGADGCEFQEFISINHHCGYSSVFEDNAKLTLDLCQHCFKAMCGDFIQLDDKSNLKAEATTENTKQGSKALLIQSLIIAMARAPSLRFMQLLMNVINPSDTSEAYYLSDEQLIKQLNSFVDEN